MTDGLREILEVFLHKTCQLYCFNEYEIINFNFELALNNISYFWSICLYMSSAAACPVGLPSQNGWLRTRMTMRFANSAVRNIWLMMQSAEDYQYNWQEYIIVNAQDCYVDQIVIIYFAKYRHVLSFFLNHLKYLRSVKVTTS